MWWRETEAVGKCQECVCEERIHMNIKVECEIARKIIFDFKVQGNETCKQISGEIRHTVY
jgi:hypothetical protein